MLIKIPPSKIRNRRVTLPGMLIAMCMVVASAGGAAAQFRERKTPKLYSEPGTYNLTVEESEWGKASRRDLRLVLRSACDQLMKHFPKRRLEYIRVRHAKSGPITLFQRTLRGEIVVELSSRDLYWSQHSFQMAHEFCHILCNFKNADPSNMWFEESLCEVASLFTLRSMAREWKSRAPYVNWREYSKSLAAYADDRLNKQKVPEGKTFLEWFRANEAGMRKKATLREKNGIVASRLLPLFEDNPEHWAAVSFINLGRKSKKQSLKEYMSNWYRNSPSKHRPFILKVAKEFGL